MKEITNKQSWKFSFQNLSNFTLNSCQSHCVSQFNSETEEKGIFRRYQLESIHVISVIENICGFISVHIWGLLSCKVSEQL